MDLQTKTADDRWVRAATGKVTDLTDRAEGNVLSKILQAVAGIDGSNLKFKRIARATSIEELGDLNAELTFAMLFVALGFKVCFEPTGERGPDLSVNRDGELAYVEVKRFRSRLTTNPTATYSVPPLFQAYGQPEKDTDKVRAELYGKFRQICGHNGILAVWSDDDGVESLEHEFAVNDMRRDDESGLLRVPENVLFSAFVGRWYKRQQVDCRAFRPLNPPFRRWAEELEQVSIQDCVRSAMTKLAKSQ